MDIVRNIKNINKIGSIDSVCPKCNNINLTVYGGSKESYPHEAVKVCKCGYREKASLTEIRSAMLFTQVCSEDDRISEVAEVIENDGITCFVVPDSIVEHFQLKPGDEFDFSLGKNGELIAKPKIDRVNN